MGGQQCCFVRFFSFVFNSKFSFQFKVFKHQLSLSALDYISQRRKLFLWEFLRNSTAGQNFSFTTSVPAREPTHLASAPSPGCLAKLTPHSHTPAEQ